MRTNTKTVAYESFEPIRHLCPAPLSSVTWIV